MPRVPFIGLLYNISKVREKGAGRGEEPKIKPIPPIPNTFANAVY
jgi:hypothetical protein